LFSKGWPRKQLITIVKHLRGMNIAVSTHLNFFYVAAGHLSLTCVTIALWLSYDSFPYKDFGGKLNENGTRGSFLQLLNDTTIKYINLFDKYQTKTKLNNQKTNYRWHF